ncbi:MAG: pentapeptide repeat-containing protein [Rhodoplanes sp.]|uniref:pentapeptide repeat-containing protein n=1 Tax=Rhodoplanes sp. TaxID=1968906 RepID=UPI0018371B29|nr:pentapeptide repeat-containing protein [Rhodoplanes sp.]NVO17651.1 pentapeptide repeat-containing protein [Rhodoplanes sp.]
MTDKKIDPYDVEALERSLNDSATRVSTIWVSFLIFGLYLVIAAGTVTHRQLFLEEPVKLPVLNIDLPLVGFFFLAPILFVIFHAYVLLQVLLLGRTAAAYNEAVDRAVKPPPGNATMRQRLANTLFAQIFAGSPRERDGWLGRLLRSMAWLTLAIAPVLVLLVFQFKFLPYHSHLVTWTHRVLILVELGAVFLLWPLALDPKRDIEWLRVVKSPFISAAALLYVVVALSLLTFPGEPHVNQFAGQPVDAVQCTRWFFIRADPNSLALGRDWVRILSFDRLDLPRIDVVDDEKLAKIEKAASDRNLPPYGGERTRNFRDRDLNCSDLSFADLRRVDLADARISGARLDGADLQGASLDRAQLQRTFLLYAQLEQASLDEAQLQGATLERANLQGASLTFAQLQGAALQYAELPGANLGYAALQHASLFQAQLQGANLFRARLHGAALQNARLEGASLDGAELHGALLHNAKLQGASLVVAELQGADLTNSTMAYTNLSGVYVWRTKNAMCRDARVGHYEANFVFSSRAVYSAGYVTMRVDKPVPIFLPPLTPRYEPDNPVPMALDVIELFIKSSIASIIDKEQQYEAEQRMRAAIVVDPAKHDGPEEGDVWRACAEASAKVSQADFDRMHAAYLRALGCDAREHRQAIAKGIIRNWISYREERRAFSAQLARGLLGEDGKSCAATKDLDDGYKERLHAAIAAATTNPEVQAPSAESGR